MTYTGKLLSHLVTIQGKDYFQYKPVLHIRIYLLLLSKGTFNILKKPPTERPPIRRIISIYRKTRRHRIKV